LEKGKEIVDVRREYGLVDLIDLAEQLNPATRAAWQNARQALALVGVSKSAYYPFLSLAAAAGYTRFFVPFPKLQVSKAALQRAIATGGPLQTAVTLTEGNPLHFDVLYQLLKAFLDRVPRLARKTGSTEAPDFGPRQNSKTDLLVCESSAQIIGSNWHLFRRTSYLWRDSTKKQKTSSGNPKLASSHRLPRRPCPKRK
jgi:hypothetical protein